MSVVCMCIYVCTPSQPARSGRKSAVSWCLSPDSDLHIPRCCAWDAKDKTIRREIGCDAGGDQIVC